MTPARALRADGSPSAVRHDDRDPLRLLLLMTLELLHDQRINRGSIDTGATDLLRARALVIAAGGDDCDVQALRLDGDPWSKSRPRHTKRGFTYTRPEDRDAELRTRTSLAPAFSQPMTGNVAMAAVFYRSNRQRIDADNMLKHLCDAATGIAWHDDSQVTAVLGVIELDPAHPRTVVAFAPHESSLTRGTDWTNRCQVCLTVFVVDPKQTAKKYCSLACSRQSRGHVLAEPVPCAHCAEPFRRQTTAQKYCGVDCSYAARIGAPKPRKRNYSNCESCGRELAHRRGGRCRECWTSDPHRQAVTS